MSTLQDVTNQLKDLNESSDKTAKELDFAGATLYAIHESMETMSVAVGQSIPVQKSKDDDDKPDTEKEREDRSLIEALVSTLTSIKDSIVDMTKTIGQAAFDYGFIPLAIVGLLSLWDNAMTDLDKMMIAFLAGMAIIFKQAPLKFMSAMASMTRGIVTSYAKSTKLVTGAMTSVIGGFLKTIGKIFSFPLEKFKKLSWVKKLTDSFTMFGMYVDDIRVNLGKNLNAFGSKIKNMFKAIPGLTKLGALFGKISGMFKPVIEGVKNIGTVMKSIGGSSGILGKVFRIVGRAFAPLYAVFSIFTNIRDDLAGAGTISEKVMAVLTGLTKGLVDTFITGPLDLVKDLVGWVAGIFGFESFKEKLDSFSFGDMMNDAVDSIGEFIMAIPKKVTDLFSTVMDYFSETWDGVKKTLSKIPGIGRFFSDEEEPTPEYQSRKARGYIRPKNKMADMGESDMTIGKVIPIESTTTLMAQKEKEIMIQREAAVAHAGSGAIGLVNTNNTSVQNNTNNTHVTTLTHSRSTHE